MLIQFHEYYSGFKYFSNIIYEIFISRILKHIEFDSIFEKYVMIYLNKTFLLPSLLLASDLSKAWISILRCNFVVVVEVVVNVPVQQKYHIFINSKLK